MPISNGHKDKLISAGSDTREEAASMVSKAMEETKRLGAFMEEKAEQATKTVGAGMESLGCTVQEYKPDTGVLHDMGESLAAKLESGGRYLETHGLTGVGEDITNMVRRNPIPALLVGIGVGILLARMVKRS